MDKRELQLKRLTTCALSDETLRDPVVACELGRLYNKDVLIRKLLDKSLLPEFAHLRLKSVVTCKFTPNPAFEAAQADTGNFANFLGAGKALWICPITLMEMTGQHPFCVLRKCGTVVSVKAIRCCLLSRASSVCPRASVSARPIGIPMRVMSTPRAVLTELHVVCAASHVCGREVPDACGENVTMKDAIVLAPLAEQAKAMRAALEAKALGKKDKKAKRKGTSETSCSSSSSSATSKKDKGKKRSRDPTQHDRTSAAAAAGASCAAQGEDSHAAAFQKSGVYASLFNSGNGKEGEEEDEGERKKRLMMIGNPRGYVRC